MTEAMPIADLRVTGGELAFAVGVVSKLGRALDVVRAQLGIVDEHQARVALATAGQSLVARELAARGDALTLAPPLQRAAEVVAGEQALLRCVKASGARRHALMFHLAPAGIVSHVVDDGIVHRLASVRGVGALIDQVCRFFDVSPIDDERPAIRVERARLTPPPGFEADVAAPRWRGAVALGDAPQLQLVAGMREWLVDVRGTEAITFAPASRQRIDAALRAILGALDSTTRGGL